MKYISRVYLLSLLMWAIHVINAVDYCNLLNCGRKHIACNNDGQFKDICPPNATILSLNQNIVWILHQFNTLRNNVALGNQAGFPKAARMAKISWSTELANLAALNVRVCDSRRDSCRNTRQFINAGQIIARVVYEGNASQQKDEHLIKECVGDWFAERNTCPLHWIQTYKYSAKKPINYHYILAITEDNSHIGCAAIRLQDNEYHRFFFTCNFATQPRIGLPVYTASEKTANQCQTGVSQSYKGLCSENEKYNTDILFEYNQYVYGFDSK